MAPRCMLVTLLGAPNVGKSTLLNRMVGAKVSIVTPKVQTTRSRIAGIGLFGETQLVFFDTPGIFKPKKRMQRAMVEAAWSCAHQSDKVVLIIDSCAGLTSDTCRVIGKLRRAHFSVAAVLNKIDLIQPPKLLQLISHLDDEQLFKDIFMISALNGDGVKDFLEKLTTEAPLGPWLYPEDQVSDIPLRMLASEMTREKLFLQLQNELPYSSNVLTEQWRERKDGSVRIDQVIFVERQSQKVIVVGKNGERVKSIGTAARRELESFLERRVHLFLHVKVRHDWSERPEHYHDLGLDFNA